MACIEKQWKSINKLKSERNIRLQPHKHFDTVHSSLTVNLTRTRKNSKAAMN